MPTPKAPDWCLSVGYYLGKNKKKEGEEEDFVMKRRTFSARKNSRSAFTDPCRP